MAIGALNGVVDSIFGWTLQFPLVVTILILSLILTLITNIAYKLMTDQSEMRRLKKRQKDLQKKFKTLKDKPKKQLEIQQQLMETNTKYMGKSMKPTLLTLIPLLFIFGWMSANLALAPVAAGTPLTVLAELEIPAQVTFESLTLEVQGDATKDTVEREVRFIVSGPEGTHNFNLTTPDGASAGGSIIIGSQASDGIISVEEPFKELVVDYPKATPFGDFSIFGYQPGWLFTYALFSVILSLTTRKLMNLA